MSISTNVLPEGRVIEVAVAGQLDIAVRYKVLATALFSMRANHYSRLLIDVTRGKMGSTESSTDAFKIIDQMRSLGFTPDVRIAFLQRGDDARRQFFEQAALFDGFDLKYFHHRDMALTWLTEG